MNRQVFKRVSTMVVPRHLAIAITASTLIACGGGGGGGGGQEPAPDYLVASIPEFYFGTRNVGTVTTQSIELSNQSGDIYPIHKLELLGNHADDFKSSFIGELTLNPAEKISVDVSFTPITNGQKAASLNIEYDIIKQVTDEENVNEQKFYHAAKLEQNGEFDASAETYQQYLSGKPATSNKQRAAIKFPVISESENHGDGEDFQLYLDAVDKRNANDLNAAMGSLEKLLSEQPNSVYADDALYMRGYIQLMDSHDYSQARDTMANLREVYPDTKYFDTALFSEALANDEMGEAKQAAGLYQDLKDRHTSEGAKILSLDLPKDNYLSRLWFDRAKQGLSRTSELKQLL